MLSYRVTGISYSEGCNTKGDVAYDMLVIVYGVMSEYGMLYSACSALRQVKPLKHLMIDVS